MMEFKKMFCFIACLFLLSCGKDKVEEPREVLNSSIFDAIYETEMPMLHLSGDLSHLMDEIPLTEKGKEMYFPAKLTISTNDSSSIELPLRIAKRGVTRKATCEFPPIKFNFSKGALKEQGYSKFHTYKFVTHCVPNGDELVVSEYLVYKLFNHLSDKSFRVKIVKIEYEDVSGHLTSIIDGYSHYGIIIEEDEELAYRLDSEMYEGDVKSVDRHQYAQMVVFQYMIGNTDWNLTRRHNIKWVQQKDVPSPTPLPYDFDYCGLVNNPSAAPHPQIPISSVRERFLQWRGKTKDELNEICKDMIADKENILNVVNSEVYLSEEKKTEMLDYLNSFFDEVGTKGI